MNLQDAIENVINDFMKGDKEFSAHDITVELRERVNAKTLIVDGVGTVKVTASGGSVDASRIVHNDVRDIVVDMFQSNKLTGYTRTNTGSFWLYHSVNAPVTRPVATAPQAAALPAMPMSDDDSDDNSAPASNSNGDGGQTASGTYDGTPLLAKKS